MSDPVPAKKSVVRPGSDIGAAEFDALLNAAVDGILVSDRRGKILRFNRAAEDMFGYTADEVLGKSIEIIMAPKDAVRHERYMDRYMQTGVRKIIGIGREVTAKRKDGSTFPVSLSVGEVRIGRGVRFVGLMRDLTAEKLAEEETLRQREQMLHVSRLTTMGEMAAAMAHEMNQPLSAIATYTAACLRLLDQGDEARDDIEKALNEISAQAHRAGEVIRRIRDFARSREHSRVPADLNSLVTEILPLAEMDARANHVRLNVDINSKLPKVVADRVQIQQVILNLLRNGVDAMIDIDEADRELSLKAFQGGPEHIQIEIRDHGDGVSEEARKNLFTPFFTTKKTGMGMGLAISRSIVSAHGGKLDCINNPDGGATFFLTLPTSIKE